MGPQVDCKLNVDHVDGPQHMFKFGSHHVNVLIIGANDNVIDCHVP